ncbi:MAG: S1C family serine protease [Solirubrobacteraceae bacterium]
MTFPSLLGAVGAGVLIGASGVFAVSIAATDHHHFATRAHETGSSRSVPAGSSAQRVYDHAKEAVAYISADSAEGQATGSGFLVSGDGRIVTNEHVVDGASKVTVKLGTHGSEQPAHVLAADASKDLALLQVDGSTGDATPLALGDSSRVQVGDTTYAIGNPYGLDHTFTSGIVSALNRDIQAPDGTPIAGAIQTDAAINPGNSGGALLDAGGSVIGVNSQIASANSQTSGGQAGNVGIGFAIPSNTVKDFVAHPTSSTPAAPSEDQQPVLPAA